jgi:hypothetical protein
MNVVGALTADGSRLLEDLSDIGIHLDHQVLLHGDLFVARLDLLPNPLVEGLADDGCSDVANPLLWGLG